MYKYIRHSIQEPYYKQLCPFIPNPETNMERWRALGDCHQKLYLQCVLAAVDSRTKVKRYRVLGDSHQKEYLSVCVGAHRFGNKGEEIEGTW